MNFFDPNSGTWNPSLVQQISILNKAEELAHVLREINRVTQVSDVIVIAHSMGGVVSRAYIENMASIGSCYNYNGGSAGSPSYSNGALRRNLMGPPVLLGFCKGTFPDPRTAATPATA